MTVEEEIDEAQDLREIAEIIRDNTDWDEVIVCAGDNEEQRVGYGYTREEWQTLREIAGTVDMVRYLIMRDHFEFRGGSKGKVENRRGVL